MTSRKTKSAENTFANLDEIQERTAEKQSKASEMAGKTSSTSKKKSTKKQPEPALATAESETEKSVMLGVRVTPDEKMRLQIYCARNRITQERAIRDFISGLEE